MRRLLAISLMLAAFLMALTACSKAAPPLALHELPSGEALSWNLVEMDGLEKRLEEDAKTIRWTSETISGKVNAHLTVKVDEENRKTTFIFSSCNDVVVSYSGIETLNLETTRTTQTACPGFAKDQNGEEIRIISSPRDTTDRFFMSILRNIHSYDVEGDQLILRDRNKSELASFIRRESVQ